MNFVPCLTWIRKGVAKEVPDKVQLTKEELHDLIEEARKELGETDLNDDEDHKNADESEIVDDVDDFAKRYNLDSYDDEEKCVPMAGLAQMTVFAENKDDPLMTLRDEGEGSDEDEDYRIKPSDNLIAVGHVENDSSILEIYVYNEDEGHLYVHHDIVLSAFPMAMEWLSFHSSEDSSGNYLAVGDMTSIIRIWDLDLVDALEPASKLGKKFKKENQDHFGHRDAVLSLSWNKSLRHVVASGSADESVLLWDLTSCQPASTLTHHSDKVQTLEFHPFESSMLLTGSCDGSTFLTDCRTEGEGKKWNFEAEVEKILWNYFDAFYYLAATEDGLVHYLDVRMSEKVFSIKAHHRAVTGMAMSSQCAGCLITVSTDRTLKIWDLTDGSGAQFVIEKKPKLGSLYCLEACPDNPFVVAMGGDKRSDNFKVWDIRQSAAARKRFAGQPLQTGAPPSEDSVDTDNAVEEMPEEQEAHATNGARPKSKQKKRTKPK